MSGGQAAVASLQVENVEHVFGLIGSATMEMFDALYDANEINFIGVAAPPAEPLDHETAVASHTR